MNPHVSQHWNLKPARLPFRHTCFLLFAQKHYNNIIKSGVCQYHFSKMQYYFNVFFQKLLTKVKKIVIIFRQAKKRRSASMEKYSRGRRGAPAKGVGRVTGARVQISPSPPEKSQVERLGFFLIQAAGLVYHHAQACISKLRPYERSVSATAVMMVFTASCRIGDRVPHK